MNLVRTAPGRPPDHHISNYAGIKPSNKFAFELNIHNKWLKINSSNCFSDAKPEPEDASLTKRTEISARRAG